MAARTAPPKTTVPLAKDIQNLGTPSQTLYVKNLNEKINKNELRRALYILFSTYGPVLDVVTTRKSAKGQSMRGQAHIVYRDIQTSTQAMRSLQGFDFLDKELKIVYGKGQSQIIPKLRGTFEPPSGTNNAVGGTDVQKSIFDAPPSSGIPTKPMENGTSTSTEPIHGTKRPRDDEESDQDDEPMEEDEDDAPMEEDDDDDD